MAQPNHQKLLTTQSSESISVKPSRRKKRDPQKIEYKSKHPSSAFLLKCAKEEEKLRKKISEELRSHLLELFNSERFADTSIINGKLIKRVHSSVLITRIPTLYEKLLSFNKNLSQSVNESNEKPFDFCIEIPFEIEESQLNLFLVKVYSDEDIRKEEIDLIGKLKYFLEHSCKHQNISELRMSKIVENKEHFESRALDRMDSKDNEDSNKNNSYCTDITEVNDFHSIEAKHVSNSEEQNSRICEQMINLVKFDEKCETEEISCIDQYSDLEVNKTNQMVRSGTFELLSSFNSDDNYDFKDLKSEKIDYLPKNDLYNSHTVAENFNKIKNENEKLILNSKEPSNNCLEEVSEKTKESNISDPKSCEVMNNCETKASNSMFSLFIDIKSISEQKSYDENKIEESIKHNGLEFIPLDYSPILDNSSVQNHRVSESKPECEKRNFKALSKKSNFSENSNEMNCNESVLKTNHSLIRSLDSVLANDIFSIKNNQTMNDIPLLPMSPIFKRKVLTNQNKNSKTNPKVNDNLEYDNFTPITSSIDPQDINALTFQQKGSDSLTSLSKEDECFSVQNTLLNRYQKLKTKTESSSASIESFDENESKNDDSDSLDSEVSEVSEVSSSLNTSFKIKSHVLSDTDLNEYLLSLNIKSCSKLGEDLLRMFIEEINTDIIIKVEDKEIKAHKCIISSRCQYFEAMLRGIWSESHSNYITLKGFSYNSVHFALCHLYSGTVSVPTNKIDLSELALLSDLLALDSLKEVVIHELKMNYCHFFHNPCDDNCIVGVINCLSLSSRCGLKDLSDNCLNWISKYFSRVWNNKVFTSLSGQLMESCYRNKINHLLPENILNTTLDCEKLITSLPRVKWAEPVFALLAKLMEECCNFIAANYDLVITSNTFLSLGRGNSWNISSLEETLLASITKLIPEVSCKSQLQLNNILLLQNNEQTGFGFGPFNEEFVRLVTKMKRYCERYMIQNANAVVHCESWSLLSPESQKRIKDSAILVFEFEKATASPPKLSSSLNNETSAKSSVKKSVEKISAEKCKDRSKGAVSKKTTNSNLKISGINAKKLNQKYFEHIYDSVPSESVSMSQNVSDKITDKSDNRMNKSLRQQDLRRRKSQEKIAKVIPFTIKTSEEKNSLNSKNRENVVGVNDLVAEIDAESNLVTHCLQEAELLEQELTRKLQKNLTSKRSVTENITQTPTHSSHTSQTRNTKTINSKTQSTSSRVKSGSLRTNNIRTQPKRMN